MKVNKVLPIIGLVFLFSMVPQGIAGAKGEADWQDESVYSILIDRFKNGNPENDYQINIENPKGFHGGDLQGVIEELDYIKSMGYTAIALSPIMENQEKGYHGRWITDFMEVEEHFGTMADMQKLVEEAHKRDMKVLLDFVVGYTGTEHPWVQDPDKTDWFLEESGIDSGQEELEGLPVLDQTNPEVKQHLLEAAGYWIKKTGVDGYLLGNVENASKEFWSDFSAHVKRIDSKFFLMGKVNSTQPESIAKYKETGIDSFVDYPFLDLASDVFSEAGNSLKPLYELWQTNQEVYGSPKLLGTLLDDKDSKRFTSVATENGQYPITRWKLALTYLFTAPGTPMVYQGTEVPMSGREVPENRQMTRINGGNEELQKYIEQMTALREELPALTLGSFELLESDGAFQLFKRTYQGESLYIAVNNDVETKTFSLNDQLSDDVQLRGLIQDSVVRKTNGSFTVTLDRETADVFIVEDNQGMNWLFIAFIVGVMGSFVGGVFYLSRKNKQTSSFKETAQ